MTQLTLVGPARVLDRQRITLAMLQLALNATQHTTTDQEIHLGTEISWRSATSLGARHRSRSTAGRPGAGIRQVCVRGQH
jgi:hypothetical protein